MRAGYLPRYPYPDALSNLVTDVIDTFLQRRDAGQYHLPLFQAQHQQVKEATGRLIMQPGTRIKPTGGRELNGRLPEISVTVLLANERLVVADSRAPAVNVRLPRVCRSWCNV